MYSEEIERKVGKFRWDAFHIRYAQINEKLFIWFCLQHFWMNAKTTSRSHRVYPLFAHEQQQQQGQQQQQNK